MRDAVKFSKRSDGLYRASTLIQFTVSPFDFCAVLEHRYSSNPTPPTEEKLNRALAALTREKCEQMVREVLEREGKEGLQAMRNRSTIGSVSEKIEKRVRELYAKEVRDGEKA